MQDRIKSIQIALENELQERDFYLQQSKRTKNPVGRRMFSRIAEDEAEHYNRLVELHAKFSQQGKWPETIMAVVKGTNVMKSLIEAARHADKTSSPDNDDRQALQIAIDFETKGYNFYSALSQNAATPSEKDFFTCLASIEREHLNSLKETLLFFEDPATWFAQHEKPGLDG